jgi:hypothetical protein
MIFLEEQILPIAFCTSVAEGILMSSGSLLAMARAEVFQPVCRQVG